MCLDIFSLYSKINWNLYGKVGDSKELMIIGAIAWIKNMFLLSHMREIDLHLDNDMVENANITLNNNFSIA